MCASFSTLENENRLLQSAQQKRIEWQIKIKTQKLVYHYIVLNRLFLFFLSTHVEHRVRAYV